MAHFGSLNGEEQNEIIQSLIDGQRWLLEVHKEDQKQLQALREQIAEVTRGTRREYLDHEARIHELERRLSDGSWQGGK